MSARESPDWTLNPYITQSTLTLLGPTFYAASIYMMLGRLIRLLDAGHHSMIKTKWLTKFFLLGDVLSFVTQGGGTLKDASVINTPKRPFLDCIAYASRR